MVILSIQYTGFCRRVGIQISIRHLVALGDGGLLFDVVIALHLVSGFEHKLGSGLLAEELVEGASG